MPGRGRIGIKLKPQAPSRLQYAVFIGVMLERILKRKSKDIHQRIAWHKKQRKLRISQKHCGHSALRMALPTGGRQGREALPTQPPSALRSRTVSAGSNGVSIRLHETCVALQSCSGPPPSTGVACTVAIPPYGILVNLNTATRPS